MTNTLHSLNAQLEILRLEYPFTKQELDHSYRTRAFESHPDVGGNAEEFKQVKEAYDLLIPFCVLSNGTNGINYKTIEGDLICDLGRGLGPTTNSDDCPECKGKGWYEHTHTTYGESVTCPVCDGSGKVKTVHNYDFWDIRWWRNYRPCRRCKGSGYLGWREILHKTLHTCLNCKGTGQIEILNPVLQKGGVWGEPRKNPTKSKKKSYCPDCGALLRNGKCWRCSKL